MFLFLGKRQQFISQPISQTLIFPGGRAHGECQYWWAFNSSSESAKNGLFIWI